MSRQTANEKPSLDILIPVLNEEGCLRASVEKLAEFMRAAMSGEYDWRVAIVDNNSDDGAPRHWRRRRRNPPHASSMSASKSAG